MSYRSHVAVTLFASASIDNVDACGVRTEGARELADRKPVMTTAEIGL